jgi:hypothetical protein
LRIYNNYLLFLVLATCLIDVSLAFAEQTDIAVYFTASVIYFSPKARKTLSFVSIVFLAGFMVVAILKIFEVMRW